MGNLYYPGATPGLYMLERLGGLIAVKPFGFRLTKTQLAVRRGGPRLSNNYCVSTRCMAVFLWFSGHFHQGFAGFPSHKGANISP